MELPSSSRAVAYFSMEIGLDSRMPTYAGGLGVLAGDTVRSAADLGVPMVAVTLLYRKGYFAQRLEEGRQREAPVEWRVEEFLRERPERVTVPIEGRDLRLRAWEFVVSGLGGRAVPVYLLDADVEGNAEADRELTHTLYGGDERYRLCQEAILGIGGVRMLRALGHGAIRRFHMNEGQAGLLALELLDERARAAGRTEPSAEDVEAVRRLCVFTTHTPVPAGHDRFPLDLAARVLGRRELESMREVLCCNGDLNMTYLALNLSHFVNGVAKRHGETAQLMFARYPVSAITNGVHAATWTAAPFQELFDRFMPGWRQDNFSLRYALGIPALDIWRAHAACKRALLARVNGRGGAGFEEGVFTVGFARRATAYKRADLFLRDEGRLAGLAERAGGLQVVYAGKAHPRDEGGKEVIRAVVEAGRRMGGRVRLAYLEDYDMELARTMTSGVDLWLNTPLPPLEASGTSGMKAALNGVPSLSVRDGWWVEGHIEGVTGWSIDPPPGGAASPDSDAASVYDKLERVILPAYAADRGRFLDVMRHAIALNGSFFNTQRMVLQYLEKAYFA